MRSTLLKAALCALPVIGGCTAALPSLEPGQMAASAAGVGSAITLCLEGDPLDAPAASNRVLTRTNAAERAVRNSPAVQAALADVHAALANAKQARLLANPVLDLNLRFPEGGGDEIIEAGLSQSLIDLLRRPARSRAADARLRAAAQQVVMDAINVLHATQRAYAEAVAAEARLAVLAEQTKLLDRLLKLAQARQEAGESSRRDVAGFSAQHAAIEAEMIQQHAVRRAARLTLTRLIGQPSGPAEFELEPFAAPADLLDEPTYLRTALAARPEVLTQTYELAALGADVTLAGFAPFDGLAAGAESETEGNTSIGPAVSIPIPIFDLGGIAKAAARAQVLAAQHRLTGISRQVVEDVRQALAAATAAQQSVDAIASRLVPLQQDRVEQTRAAYEAGVVDVTDVLQAEQDLLQAQAQLVEAKLRRAHAEADLRRAAGGVPSTEHATPSTVNATSR